VFTWAEDGETGAPRSATVGNHHLLYWKHGGVEWWVVGDNLDDVTRFAGELKARST
jgi:anti-sigma factor RsiW